MTFAAGTLRKRLCIHKAFFPLELELAFLRLQTVRSQGLQRFRLVDTLNCTAVLDAVQACFALKPDPRAFHMMAVPAGAVVQDIFPHPLDSASGIPHPFELKILVVWGQTLVINTQHIPGSKYLFPDGTYSGTNVALMSRLIHAHVPILIRVAEALARAIGSPTLRIDFFVSSQDSRWALNELELVSGVGYHDFHVQPCMAALWRRPYMTAQFFRVNRTTTQTQQDVLRTLRELGFSKKTN
jgi:hypothetical protein